MAFEPSVQEVWSEQSCQDLRMFNPWTQADECQMPRGKVLSTRDALVHLMLTQFLSFDMIIILAHRSQNFSICNGWSAMKKMIVMPLAGTKASNDIKTHESKHTCGVGTDAILLNRHLMLCSSLNQGIRGAGTIFQGKGWWFQQMSPITTGMPAASRSAAYKIMVYFQ